MMLNGRGGQGEKVEEVVFLAESLLIGACEGFGVGGGVVWGEGRRSRHPTSHFQG